MPTEATLPLFSNFNLKTLWQSAREYCNPIETGICLPEQCGKEIPKSFICDKAGLVWDRLKWTWNTTGEHLGIAGQIALAALAAKIAYNITSRVYHWHQSSNKADPQPPAAAWGYGPVYAPSSFQGVIYPVQTAAPAVIYPNANPAFGHPLCCTPCYTPSGPQVTYPGMAYPGPCTVYPGIIPGAFPADPA
jgi:hypothetical protein